MSRRPAARTVTLHWTTLHRTTLHWTTLLGVISLACLAVLVATGVVLMFFFDPSSDTVRYGGSDPLLRGVPISKAYASTLHVSLEVRGGLLVRQAHHWAALVLPASVMTQMLAAFFTGRFRRPRRWGWVLLTVTFGLVLAGGWSGSALPDDLLAGTSLRIAQGVLVGTPLVGARASFLLFGGEYPGSVVERLYWLHVAVLPALLAVVLLLRLRLARSRPPARVPGRAHAADRTAGLPRAGVLTRAAGLFLVASGLLVLLAGIVSISPVWRQGPSSAAVASAGSRPDWPTAFLDGALRLVPSGWEATALGGTVPVAVLLPQAAVGVFFALVLLWPFLEARVTGDHDEHQVLDRPRERPVRTAFGVAGLTFFLTLLLAGATDLVTTQLGIPFEHQVLALRALLVLGPVMSFELSRRLCVALVAGERQADEHGPATGRIVRGPEGGYAEPHAVRRDGDPAAATDELADPRVA